MNKNKLKKILQENIYDFIERNSFPPRVINHIFNPLKRKFYQRYENLSHIHSEQREKEILKIIFIEDLLNIPQKEIEKWRNVGKKTLGKVLDILKKEGVPESYPLMNRKTI